MYAPDVEGLKAVVCVILPQGWYVLFHIRPKKINCLFSVMVKKRVGR